MKRSRKFALGLVALLVVGIGTVVLANYWKSKLVVEHVIVSGTSIVDPDSLVRLARVPTGIKMMDVDLHRVEARVSRHPYVEHVIIERNLPSTITINVTERRPLALLNGRRLRSVDREGIVLPSAASRGLFDLPVITGLSESQPLTPGSRISNNDLAEALRILETARAAGKEISYLISEIRVRSGGDLVLYTSDGGVPVIYGKGEAARKLIVLETFWKTIVAERGSQALQYVDLRFEGQVVARWKSKS